MNTIKGIALILAGVLASIMIQQGIIQSWRMSCVLVVDWFDWNE
jgi:hypothetical protein